MGRAQQQQVTIAGTRAGEALDRWATHRRAAPVRIPARLVVALEGAASAFLDHPRGAVPTPVGALAQGSGMVRAPTLSCCALIEEAMDKEPGPGSITESAQRAAQIARARRFADRSDRVGRALLATWPGRQGLLDGVPTPISRSLADAGVGSPVGLGFDDHVSLLLSAVTDAAERMLRAEVDLCRLRHSYIRQLQYRGESSAQEIVSLILSDPIVTVDAVVHRFGVSPDGARAGLEELTARGWLARVNAEDCSDRPDWVSTGLVNTLVGAFEDPTPGGAFEPIAIAS